MKKILVKLNNYLIMNKAISIFVSMLCIILTSEPLFEIIQYGTNISNLALGLIATWLVILLIISLLFLFAVWVDIIEK